MDGIIRKRKSQFTIDVKVDGVVYNCHCPTTGRIGNIVLNDIPCLLSKSKDKTRKTPYTVEAISLDLKHKKNKSWIGINQNAVNRYVEHFIRTGQFYDMVRPGETVKREQTLRETQNLIFLLGTLLLRIKHHL